MEPRFNDDGTLNDRRHKHDHNELGQILDSKMRNKELMTKVKTSIIVGGVIFLFTSLGSIVWYAFSTFVGASK